jgi:hypothetical protein
MMVLALSSATPTTSFAQAIQFLPGQQILACPNHRAPPPVRRANVCTRTVLVGGGQPLTGYTFSVTSGHALPAGIFLLPLTGVITMQSPTSVLPPPKAGGYDIPLTVTDGRGHTKVAAKNTVRLIVQPDNAVCGCPIFAVQSGPLPPAQVNRPYAVTLSVFGPPASRVLRPTFHWTLAPRSVLPSGLILDQARGVVRGTPRASAAGRQFQFFVRVRETKSNTEVASQAPYSLFVR